MIKLTKIELRTNELATIFDTEDDLLRFAEELGIQQGALTRYTSFKCADTNRQFKKDFYKALLFTRDGELGITKYQEEK